MKILLIKTSALGDVIQCFSVLHFLKQAFPDARVDWAVEKGFSKLLEAHPLVHRVIHVELKKWKKAPLSKDTRNGFKKAKEHLQKETYDVIFDLQGNIKSGLIAKFAKGKEKVGFTFSAAPEWPSSLFVKRRYAPNRDQSVPAQYLSLVQKHFSKDLKWVAPDVTLSISPEEETWLKETIETPLLPRLMVCIGSNWENKKLSLATWRDFLKKVDEHCHPFFFFVWGSEKEKEDVEALHAHFPNSSRVLPKMSLPLWQRCMQCMEGVLAVDSSALHLAATASTPTFSLFGPSAAQAYRPEGKQHQAFQGTCPYGKTFHKRCPLLRTCSTGACLKDVTSTSLINMFKTWFEHVSN